MTTITVLFCFSAAFLSLTIVAGERRYDEIELKPRSFDWICKEQRNDFASLGPCSRQYLECGYNGAILRSCLDYEVWSDIGCVSGSDSFCAISTYERDSVNSRTERLAKLSNFCDRNQGVFFAAKYHKIDECARQAVVCFVGESDLPTTTVITCPNEYVLNTATMNCTLAPNYCFNKYDSGERTGAALAIHQFLVDNICASGSSYSYESNLCSSWFLDCRKREVVNCPHEHFYDHKKEKCVSKHKIDSCVDETVCYGGEWSKKLQKAPCQQLYTWCRGGQILDYACIDGRIFDGNGCKDKNLVRECNEGTCVEGETFKHEDCNKYLRCYLGELLVENCGQNQAWSVAQQKCIYDQFCTVKSCEYYGTCDLKTCNEGHSYRDSNHCTGKYTDCVHGYYEEKSCGPNYSWNVQGRKCVYDAGCLTPGNDIYKDICRDDTTLAIDCYSYDLCKHGKWQQVTCEIKPLHNWERKICEFAVGCNAIGNSGSSCSEGDSFASANYCNKYWTCTTGKYIENDCGAKWKWSSDLRKCVYDENCQGDRINRCREGATLEIDCNRYAFCELGVWQEKKCDSYNLVRRSFNDNQRVCSCAPIEPPRCIRGFRYGHDTDCNKYFECIDSDYVEKVCESSIYDWHKEYNLCSFNRQCKREYRICEEGNSYPHEDAKLCAKYRKCQHNSFTYYDCEKGFYFNTKIALCVYDIEYICHPKPAIQSPPRCIRGYRYGHDTNCNKYFECIDGGYVEKVCESSIYEWHKEYNLCSFNRQCQREYRICEEGNSYPHEDAKLCAKYRKCQHNSFTYYDCEKGFYFDTKIAQCVYDNEYVCHPKPAVQSPTSDGCIGVHLKHESCNKYYRCNKGTYTEETCGVSQAYNHEQRACVLDHHCRPYLSKCTIGSYGTYPFDCRLFYQCDHGKWALRPCAPGTAWSQSLLTCDHLGNGQCY